MAEPFLGEIRTFAFDFAPKGWAKCEGQVMPINQNQALFALLGTIVRRRRPGHVRAPGPARPRDHLRQRRPPAGRGRRRGGARADASPSSPAHSHRAKANASTGNSNSPTENVWAANPNAYRASGSANMDPNAIAERRRATQPHNTMQPYLALQHLHRPHRHLPGAVVTGPSELGSAFAGEAVAAVKRSELRGTDPQLAAALGAGWYLAALCHGAGANRTAAAVRGSAMGFASFESGQATAFSRDQVQGVGGEARGAGQTRRARPARARRPRAGERPAGRQRHARRAQRRRLPARQGVRRRRGAAAADQPPVRRADAQGAPHEHHRRAAGRGDRRPRHGVAAARRAQRPRVDPRVAEVDRHRQPRSLPSRPRRGSCSSARASCGGRCWPARRPGATCSRSTTTSTPPSGSPSGCADSSCGSW